MGIGVNAPFDSGDWHVCIRVLGGLISAWADRLI